MVVSSRDVSDEPSRVCGCCRHDGGGDDARRNACGVLRVGREVFRGRRACTGRHRLRRLGRGARCGQGTDGLLVRLRRRRGAQHLDQHGAGPGAEGQVRHHARSGRHGHQRHSHAAVWRDAGGRDGRLHRLHLDQRRELLLVQGERLLVGPLHELSAELQRLHRCGKPRGGLRFRLSHRRLRMPLRQGPDAAVVQQRHRRCPADHRRRVQGVLPSPSRSGDLPRARRFHRHCLHLLPHRRRHRKGRVREALVHGRPPPRKAFSPLSSPASTICAS